MITADGLCRKYGDFTAVDNVSFSIPKGQVVGLLGHNGAGKTTIMKMLTGYLEPSAGSATVCGFDVVKEKENVQSQIGYLPEVSPLYPDLTVAEYLEYVTALRGIEQGGKVAAIKRVVEQTALGEKLAARISTLSKGYKQRLGVAQAIIHNPAVLVLDEPTSGLDPSQITEMRSLFAELSKDSTVIISTHILQEVEAMCDRAIIILNGKVAADAELSELQTADTILLETDKDLAQVQENCAKIKGVYGGCLVGDDGAGRYRYEIKTTIEPFAVVPDITRMAVAEGWQIFSISPERKTLETVFREINSKM